MKTQAELSALLFELDSRGYKAYKQIKGEYDFEEFTLIIDYVQGDPFAAPTQCSAIITQRSPNFLKNSTAPSAEKLPSGITYPDNLPKSPENLAVSEAQAKAV